MKKLTIAATAIFTLTAFAVNTSTKFIDLLTTTCPGAERMHYKTVRELASIDFLLHGSHMQAFYSSDADQAGTSCTIHYKNLPWHSKAMLENKFKGYTATEVIELAPTREEPSYYVWLVKDSEKVIAQININGEMSVFKKSDK